MLLNNYIKYSLLFIIAVVACSKESSEPQLCIEPVGEFSSSVYLYREGKVYGEAEQEFCISKGLISFYAEPIPGYKFVKWCGYSDTYNSPLTSRFSNPGIFGSYGPVNSSIDIKLEAIYKVKGTSDPLGSCD